jgi:hypothetical protein
MSRRRGGTLWYTCAYPGCVESGCSDYASQRELAELKALRKEWMCMRHKRAHEILSSVATEKIHVMVVTSKSESNHRYWADEGSPLLKSGIQSGPGFMAYAEDFPVGTRLIVTARIEAESP